MMNVEETFEGGLPPVSKDKALRNTVGKRVSIQIECEDSFWSVGGWLLIATAAY